MTELPGTVRKFDTLDVDTQSLIQKAAEARELAYAPYSSFKVGCALITKKGDIYTGCNVENASYGLTICAEKAAIVKAVSHGDKDIIKMAVVANMGDHIVAPCGSCRQFIYEFSSNTDIVVHCIDVSLKRTLEVTSSELLPWGFRLYD